MTSLVDETTRSVIAGSDVESLTTTFGLIVVILTLVLLVERELLRGIGRDAAERAGRIRFIVVPCLLLTMGVLGARFASLAG
ncbi:MAG TPA: hypothetical protein VN213_05890 [Solirubrobacteraceae bacterium]|nr:hypothetical protein [Solirubrobacteraceae bacterium]